MAMKAPTVSIVTPNLLLVLCLLASLQFASSLVLPAYSVKAIRSAPKKQEESLILQKNDKTTGASVIATAGFSVAFLLSTLALPLPAAAVADGSSFSGSYSDPIHPNCKRVIEVVATGNGQVLLSGTDGTPGCPADGSGREWVLNGRVDTGDGSKILVDFSPKGGPRDLTGQFFEGKDSSGIKWPDGNTWTKK